MHEDEMLCIPCSSQGSVLITDSPALSSAWNSVSLALGIFFFLTLFLKVHSLVCILGYDALFCFDLRYD